MTSAAAAAAASAASSAAASAGAGAGAGADAAGAMTAEAVLAFLRARGIDPATSVVKVLLLGNSGAGKSLLCNAILGEDAFEHKMQGTSCTADNSFSLVELSDGAWAIVCNIPGLIEAETDKIDRNKRAIKAAFELLPGAPTAAVFVLSCVGGRPVAQDYQAIRCTCDYVKIADSAMAVVANGVDWAELDDAPEDYRADITLQTRAITKRPTLRVDFVGKLAKAVRSNYASAEMRQLQAQLVALLKSLSPRPMQPEPGAEIELDTEKLKSQMQEMKDAMERERAAHAEMMQNERAKWDAQVQAMDAAHKAAMARVQAEIVELRNRPPQIVHVGCFCAATSAVRMAATGEQRAIGDVRAGDVVLGFDRATGRAVPTRVLLVDLHPAREVVRMVRIGFADGGALTMTPDHLVFRLARAATMIDVVASASAAAAAVTASSSSRSGANAAAAGDVAGAAAARACVELVQAGALAVGDRVCFAEAGGRACKVVASLDAGVLAQPANVYTANDTVVVGGACCSCHVISEWYGWLDMLDATLLAWVAPGATGSRWYEAARRWWDGAVGERFLYGVLG